MSERPLALVTGANRGLGLESVRQLVSLGYQVLLCSRDLEAGKKAAASIPGATLGAVGPVGASPAAAGSDSTTGSSGTIPTEGGPAPADSRRSTSAVPANAIQTDSGPAVEVLQLDVTSPEDIASVARLLEDRGEALDVLISNAGVSLDGSYADQARRTLAVNFFGACNVETALRRFLRTGGRTVMVSSILGRLSSFSTELRRRFLDPGLDEAGLSSLVDEYISAVSDGSYRSRGWPSSAYTVSKAALNARVRILAPLYAESGRRINAVHPGWVRTDMGGAGAPLSLSAGGRSILWAASADVSTNGGFFQDGRAMDW